jgi:hypothetical protein
MQGTVERIQRKGRRTALRIDGEWYSTFEPIEVGEGDRVEFSFKTVRKNGREYKNLKTIEVIGAEEAQAPDRSRGREINRAVALKAALHWAEVAGETDVGAILNQAEGFLAWLEGKGEESIW